MRESQTTESLKIKTNHKVEFSECDLSGFQASGLRSSGVGIRGATVVQNRPIVSPIDYMVHVYQNEPKLMMDRVLTIGVAPSVQDALSDTDPYRQISMRIIYEQARVSYSSCQLFDWQ